VIRAKISAAPFALSQVGGEFPPKDTLTPRLILDAFANNFQWTKTKEDFEKWIKFYESIENSEIYSEKSFEEFKKEFSK